MDETTKRPDAVITCIWNPNTGKLDIKFTDCSMMEAVGVLANAQLGLCSSASKSPILETGPIMGHLLRR